MSNEFIVIPPEDRNLKIIDYNDYNVVHNPEETDESLFNGKNYTSLQWSHFTLFINKIKWRQKISFVHCQNHKKTII